MQRARGVGADIFQLNFFPAVIFQVAVIFSFGNDVLQHIVHPVLLQIKINEAGTGNLRFFNICAVKIINYGLGNHARIAFQAACGLHGKIGGKIAELFLRRNLQQNLRQCPLFQNAVVNSFLRCIFDGFSQNAFNVQPVDPPLFLLKSSSRRKYRRRDTVYILLRCAIFPCENMYKDNLFP